MKIEIYGLRLPEVRPGDDLARLIVDTASRDAGGIVDGDILIVTSKIVSKAYGLLIKLDDIKPSGKALKISRKIGEDPRFIQAVLDNSDRILFVLPFLRLVEKGMIDLGKISKNPGKAMEVVKRFPYIFFVERGGQIYSDAGIDSSNHPEGIISVPPRNPDEVARRLRRRIAELTGKDVAVIISDTEFMPFVGSLDIARGSSGIQVISRNFGELDLYGKPKFGGVDNIANQLASAAALLMGQTSEGIPAVLIRGYKYVRSEEGILDNELGMNRVREIIREILRSSIKILGIRWLIKLLI